MPIEEENECIIIITTGIISGWWHCSSSAFILYSRVSDLFYYIITKTTRGTIAAWQTSTLTVVQRMKVQEGVSKGEHPEFPPPVGKYGVCPPEASSMNPQTQIQ